MRQRSACYFFLVLLLALGFGGKSFAGDLSEKAAGIKMGMTRESVVALLGPATWASIPGDSGDFAIPDPRIGLYLYWQKSGCPVAVDFDPEMKVIGVDEGRLCLSSSEPPEKFSCKKKDREKYCY